MSEHNVELTRRVVEAFNARDIEGFIEYFDPSIEYHSALAAVGGEVYHGHEGLRTYHHDLEDAWGDEIRAEAEAYFDLGDQTLAFITNHARGRHSGVEVAMPNALVFRWRDGLTVYFKGYALRQAALS